MALITETNRKWWTLAAVTFSLFMIMLDTTIVNVALPAIQTDFKVQLSQLEWTVNAYTLTYAVFLLTGGKLADLTGRRLIFMIGLIGFAGSSLVCAVAPSIDVLIAARAVQGVGAALMLPATLSIISSSFAPHERGAAIGIWAAVSGIGLAIGPLVGGILVEWLSWRWIFYINVPIGILGFIAALIIIRESRDPAEDQGLDVPGLVTSGVALFALTYGLIEGNNYGWTSQRIVVSLAVFAVLLAVFIVIESRSRAPMVDLRLFRNGTFSGANIVGLLIFLAIVGLLFFVSIYLQVVLGFSPIQTGASFLPLTVMIVIASPISGKVTDWIGARWPMAVGMILLTVMLILLARATKTDARFLDFLPALLIGGFGFGLVMPPMTTAVLSTVDTRLAGIASGVLSSFRQSGSALGVAVMGAIVAHELGGLTPRDAGFAHSYVNGFKDSLYLAAACTLVGALISAIFIRREDAVEAALVEAGAAAQVPEMVAQTPIAGVQPVAAGQDTARDRREHRPAVVVAGGNLAGERFEVENELTVGREASDLALDDRQVSRRHAIVRALEDGLEVTDLGSANGTFVNGKRIAETLRLEDGDVVRVGQTSLLIEVPWRPDRAAPTTFAPAFGPLTLVVASGSRAGERFEIRSELSVGREGTDLLLIDDLDVSRRHAIIRPADGLAEIEDVGSANGTFVNGERLVAARRLVEGDVVRVGRTLLNFELPIPSALSAPTVVQRPPEREGGSRFAPQ